MDAHPSSSEYASNSNNEKHSSNGGLSKVRRARVQKSTVQGSSSSTKLLHNSQNDKHNGKGIISVVGHFEEVTGGKKMDPNILEAESSHIAVINNRQVRTGTQRSLSDTHRVGIDGKRATDLLCGCCYWEFPLEEIVCCTDGHLCCFKCLRKHVEEIIYGGLKAHGSLSCMDMGGCKESIPLSEISRVLPKDVFEKYEYRQAQEAIVEAKVEGLVYCPFCNIPYEVDKCLQVLECANTKCLKVSCIQCKKLNHLPLLCEEVQKMPGTLRGEVEERMTKAVIRECNICHTELIKMEGTCNKVRCICGNTMCYVCRQSISPSYYHFCNCITCIVEPRKPCQICNKCNLMEQLEEENEAMDAKEDALTERQFPGLLPGTPLGRQRAALTAALDARHQGLL